MMADEMPWQVTFEESPDGKFTKRNPRMYRAVIGQLAATINQSTGKSQIATVKVDTGDMTVVNRKRRGKNERVEESAFRAAAQERGYGVRIDPTHFADGHTDLRIQLQPKKEFSAEAIESRKQKLANARALKKAERDREQTLAQANKPAAGTVKKTAAQ